MATKAELIADPNSCWNQAADDAPVFVMIPTDSTAPETIRSWAGRLVRTSLASSSAAKAMDALEVAEHFEKWGHKNGCGVPGSGWNKAKAPTPERSIPRYPDDPGRPVPPHGSGPDNQ